MEYLIKVVTFFGKAEIKFPATEWDMSQEPSIKYQNEQTKKALHYFIAKYGVGVKGIRFYLDWCKPSDIIGTLEFNDSYHKDPIIFAWSLVHGKIPEPDNGIIAESLADAVRDAMGHEDATKGMKDAGNYRKGHCRIAGFDVAIENPAGSYRKGVSLNGKPWKSLMNHHYGYIKGSIAVDNDHVDVFFNPDLADEEFKNRPWFVIDQISPSDGSYDEPKVVAGYKTKAEAKAAYMSNYEAGWEGLGDIHEMSYPEFKEWVFDKSRTTKPVNPVFESISGTYKFSKEQSERLNSLIFK